MLISMESNMKDFFRKLADIEKEGRRAALAIVVSTKGSTPRKAGTKMIIMEDGSTLGTLGGGGLEKKVIEESLEALKGGEARLTSFNLDGTRGNLDMMCGGEIEIYIANSPTGETHHIRCWSYYKGFGTSDAVSWLSANRGRR